MPRLGYASELNVWRQTLLQTIRGRLGNWDLVRREFAKTEAGARTQVDLETLRSGLESSKDDILSVLDCTFLDSSDSPQILTHIHLSDDDQKDADLIAHVTALRATNELCTFVFEYSGGELLGFWHGPDGLSEEKSDIVVHDTEGHYEIIPADNLSEALCYWHLYNSEDEEEFGWLVEAFSDMGFKVRQLTFGQVESAILRPRKLKAKVDPNGYRDLVYRQG